MSYIQLITIQNLITS